MVGFFDSGVGGITVLQEVQRLLPTVSTVYFADTAHFPYGTKTEEEVSDFAVQATERLLEYSPQAIVIACNSASTAALDRLRSVFPDTPFIGVVPAIKPAAALSLKKKIAVLATARTLASSVYMKLKQEYAAGVTVLDQACSGWVEIVESGDISSPEADAAVRDVIEPLARQGVDAYVLGCTHYPFLRSQIQHFAGNGSSVLDSGTAVAKQLEHVVQHVQPQPDVTHRFVVSGDHDQFITVVQKLLKKRISVEPKKN